MKDINPIYYNQFGIAFKWKNNTVNDITKVQMVFRDTGFLLTKEELVQFSKSIKCTLESAFLCSDCLESETCRALLVDTPAPQVSLAMSKKELLAVDDLVAGTLFELSLSKLLDL